MALWKEIGNRFAWLFRRSRFDRELEDEIGSHIQACADDLEQGGMTRAEALRQARRQFGPMLRSREESRSAWQVRWLEDLVSDLRYAVRALRRDIALTLAAVGSLALGIGANTTVIGVAREALFSQPSCRDPQSLVQISVSGNPWIPMAQYRLLEAAHAFEGVAGMNIQLVANWRDGNRTYRLAGTRVTGNFFELMGIPVAMGRPIGRGDTNVAVITHRFWTNRLGSDPSALGRTLTLDGEPYTVVGVLPPDHRMLAGFGFTPDLYLTKDPIEAMVYARLPRGMSRQAALARLRPVSSELDRVYPDVNRKWASEVRLSAVGGLDRLAGNGQEAITIAGFFGMLVVVTAIVVLIACANVSSLLLARAFTRSREFAIRMSLGGSRGRLIRQLLTESLLLALLGTGAGLLLNLWLSRLLSGVRIPTPLPIQLVIQPDGMLLAYSVALTFLVTLGTGMAPALKGTRAGIGGALTEGGRQTGPAGNRLRNAMVAGQLAVSILLLTVGLLFIRNLMYATSFNAGFDTSHTVVATLQTAWGTYTPKKFAGLVDTALERLRELPGVDAASPASAVPLNPFLAFNRPGGQFRPDAGSRAVRVQYNFNNVGPDYFRIMGIPILEGRAFAESDGIGTPRVVILNENMARRLFGSAGPVGHILRFPDNRDATVVGVARNSKYVTLGEENSMALYEPHAQQNYAAFAHFFVRTRVAPGTMLRQVNETLAGLDAGSAVETHSMDEIFAGALMPSRVVAALLGSMALFGLLLASVGLYGVMLYATQQRVREIGIRVALGATPRDILAITAGKSLRLVGAGMVIGLAVAAFAVRPLSAFLVPEVRPADPMNFVAVSCVLALVTAIATLPPTVRALRIDPAVALRHE